MMIKKLIKGILPLITVMMLLSSCNNDNDIFGIGDDTDVITITSPSMTKLTMSRALDESLENKIYSIYFFIVNANGTVESKKYIKLTNPDNTYNCKLDKKVDGSQRVYAIANAEFSENSFDADHLKTQMDNATTEAQLKEIYASYASGQENFTRPQGHLLMSGWLENPSTTNNTIEIKHVDARVNFAITVDNDAIKAGAEFTPKSYQIINIPRRSYLVERAAATTYVNTSNPYACDWDALSCTSKDDYFDSDENAYFSKSYTSFTDNGTSYKKMKAMFDFYMLENRKTAVKTTGGVYPTNYAERERKDGDWKFTNAHEFATYVVIKGTYKKSDFELEQELKDEANSPAANMVSRYADVEYTVHLGDFGSESDKTKSTDNFYTERNCNYTYNVTINNAKNIAVEAVKTEEDERQSSAEGTVADAYLAFADIDAHFGNVFISINLDALTDDYFTKPDNCLISNSPYGTDYSWIQFAPIDASGATPQEADMMSWKTAAEGKLLISMDMLPDFIKYLKDNPTSPYVRTVDGVKMAYFTAFIDENYPQKDLRDTNYKSWFMPKYGPDDTPKVEAMKARNVTGADPDISWDQYINRANRELKLFNLPYTSPDGRSHYTISQVMITQRSIQSFYNIGNVASALGVEHTDETGHLRHNDQKTDAGYISATDGRANTLAQMKQGATSIGNWETYLKYGVNSTKSQFTWSKSDGDNSGTYRVPLQRNRDINADGEIQDSEIRWYTPAIDQLVSVSLAGQALLSPLYDQALEATYSPMERNGIPMHHTSSTGKNMLWTEEIVSVGKNGEDGKTLYNRCVRTLGTVNNEPDSYYDYNNATHIVTYSGLNQSILRATVAEGELIPMTEWDVTNRLPKYGFKVAKDNAGSTVTMKDLDASISPCSTYSETGTAYDGVGKWRVPNILEIAMMSLSGSALNIEGDSSGKLMSCTKFSWSYKQISDPSVTYLTPQTTGGYWYSSNNHHFLTWDRTYITLSSSTYDTTTKSVRCVRDIQPGEF